MLDHSVWMTLVVWEKKEKPLFSCLHWRKKTVNGKQVHSNPGHITSSSGLRLSTAIICLALLPVTCDSVEPIAICQQVKHTNFPPFHSLKE